MGRGRRGGSDQRGGRSGSILCHRILIPLLRRAAQHGSPRLCTHSTKKTHWCREEMLPYSDSSLIRHRTQLHWNFGCSRLQDWAAHQQIQKHTGTECLSFNACYSGSIQGCCYVPILQHMFLSWE